ncbi:MAG: SsrA-binding protein SmpB [Bdellovibrionota bacterium]
MAIDNSVGILLIQENKKARFDFEILRTFEAGLVLTGSEVKSVRDKSVQLKDSYVVLMNGEAYLQNAHIAPYKAGSYNNHEPERRRKLLLNAKEIEEIDAALTEKGHACVALKIYFKKGRAKVEIAIARGKKKGDKRESIKKRDVEAQLRQVKRLNR